MSSGVMAKLLLVLFLLSAPLANANPLSGTKKVLLLDSKGNEIVIGEVIFTQGQVSSMYRLHIDHDLFRDYFLSMKEMKCLEGPELWCHLPYPYRQPHEVSTEDLSWLSHDLLFMFKKKDEFGANFWNGIYYRIWIEDNVIKGEAEAVDLNILASPPDDLDQPPIGEGERDEIERAQRWLPDLIIR